MPGERDIQWTSHRNKNIAENVMEIEERRGRGMRAITRGISEEGTFEASLPVRRRRVLQIGGQNILSSGNDQSSGSQLCS